MQVFRYFPIKSTASVALTIGNFDGVHRGHQEILKHLIAEAQQRSLVPTVMTFEPYPAHFFSIESQCRLMSLSVKLARLKAMGVLRVYVVRFDAAFAALSAQHFIEKILIQSLGTRWLLVGDDFRFGASRQGEHSLLMRYAEQGAFQLSQLPTFFDGQQRISSSRIRTALCLGQLEQANQLLGTPLMLSGRVLKGRQLARKLGFPTANIALKTQSPMGRGVFVVRVQRENGQFYTGMANVGIRPTLCLAQPRLYLEVHLFQFSEMLYAEKLRVFLLKKLREECQFDSLEKLRDAIEQDFFQARAYLEHANCDGL